MKHLIKCNVHIRFSVYRGVEWVNHNLLLSYGHPSANSSGLVRNELAVLFMDTGKIVQLKKNDNGYHNPIVAVRVSPHK